MGDGREAPNDFDKVETVLDFETTEQLFESSFAVTATSFDVVTVTGKDAASFLQGQLSQDILALAIGECRYSMLLQPQGKLVAWLRVLKQTDESFWLLAEPGYGKAVQQRLQRFKLRVAVALDMQEAPGLMVRGKRVDESIFMKSPFDSSQPVVEAQWPQMPGVDVIGTSAIPHGMQAGSPAAFEALRIRCAMPKMGAELDEKTIPAAASIVDISTSFTKGCYVGQELTARLDARGNNTPFTLETIDESSGYEFELLSGSELKKEGDVVGNVTSAIVSPTYGKIALAYIKRSIVRENIQQKDS